MRALLLVLCLTPWGACRVAASERLVLHDDLRREVVFTERPRRLISLLPSLTEAICALGACDRLVATDRFSNFPARAAALPKVGGLDDASVESMVSLKPDLILLSNSQRITERLGELGVQSFTMKTESYDDIGHTLRMLGQILGLADRAAELEQRIDGAVGEIGRTAAARRAGAPSLRVYFEVDRAPYAAGPASFIGELLTRLGTRNIVTADLGPYPKINPEYVVRGNPDVIFVAAAEAPRLVDRPGWRRVRAVEEHRLCSFDANVNDTIVRPGPRVAEGMRALAECLERVAP